MAGSITTNARFDPQTGQFVFPWQVINGQKTNFSNPRYDQLPDYIPGMTGPGAGGSAPAPAAPVAAPAAPGGGTMGNNQGLVSQMAINQGNADIAGLPGMQQINLAAANAADPFGSQRGQYQNQLANLMQGKFSANDPSYDWRFKQGQQALERSAAAKGFLGSGNILAELQNYGQGQASQEYQNQYNRLLPLTGATTGSPGAAGQITSQLYDWRNNALANIGAGWSNLPNQSTPSWAANAASWGR